MALCGGLGRQFAENTQETVQEMDLELEPSDVSCWGRDFTVGRPAAGGGVDI